jgi:hypothetical protein
MMIERMITAHHRVMSPLDAPQLQQEDRAEQG